MGAIQVLLICVFTAMMGLGIIGPIIPIYAENLGATFVQIGLLSSVWSISRLIFTAPVGNLADRTSKKKIIAAGLGVYTVLSLLYAVAWDYTSLITVRFFHGLGSAMSMPIAMAYAAEISPEGREGKFMGNLNMAMFAGMGLGPLIGGYLTDYFTLSAPFYAMGAMAALSLLLTLRFLPDDKKHRGERRRDPPSFRKVLSIPVLRAVFIYRAVGALGRGSIWGFLSLYISGSVDIGGLGLPVSVAGLILSVGQLSSAILQSPTGTLADKYDKRHLTFLGGLVGAVGLLMFPFSNTAWEIMLARLVFAVGSAIGMPALSAIAAIEGRELGVGTTMSVLQSAMSLGMIVGPLLSGFLVDIYGLKPIFFVSFIITLFGTASFWRLSRSYSPGSAIDTGERNKN
ncbi:MFS transporter [Candidatus Bathyarchaeota archaeon]|nr:MFS transporter [Candidatus Bathyarchaeota archaeon]